MGWIGLQKCTFADRTDATSLFSTAGTAHSAHPGHHRPARRARLAHQNQPRARLLSLVIGRKRRRSCSSTTNTHQHTNSLPAKQPTSSERRAAASWPDSAGTTTPTPHRPSTLSEAWSREELVLAAQLRARIRLRLPFSQNDPHARDATLTTLATATHASRAQQGFRRRKWVPESFRHPANHHKRYWMPTGIALPPARNPSTPRPLLSRRTLSPTVHTSSVRAGPCVTQQRSVTQSHPDGLYRVNDDRRERPSVTVLCPEPAETLTKRPFRLHTYSTGLGSRRRG